MTPTSTSRPLLTPRALNRATLARQGLLARSSGSVLGLVDHLVGLQAQVPRDPYVALWSRLSGFEPSHLERLLADRSVARSPLMRGTIHLATARDCRDLRPLMQPVLRRAQQAAFGRRLAGADLAALAEAGRALLDARPLTFRDLRTALGAEWSSYDPTAVTYSVSYLVPLVQVPPRGMWTATGPPTWATTAAWLGQPDRDDRATIGDVVLRYLAAFGPASVQDVQAWCGLTRLAEVVDALRPRLMTFSDERRTELFDLPDAPRPDPGTPSPVRFLPQYDNVFLAHADRSRIVPNGAGTPWAAVAEAGWVNPVLVDGFITGLWRLVPGRRDAPAVLRIQELGVGSTWTAADREELQAEGRALLGWLVPEPAAARIDFAPLAG